MFDCDPAPYDGAQLDSDIADFLDESAFNEYRSEAVETLSLLEVAAGASNIVGRVSPPPSDAVVASNVWEDHANEDSDSDLEALCSLFARRTHVEARRASPPQPAAEATPADSPLPQTPTELSAPLRDSIISHKIEADEVLPAKISSPLPQSVPGVVLDTEDSIVQPSSLPLRTAQVKAREPHASHVAQPPVMENHGFEFTFVMDSKLPPSNAAAGTRAVKPAVLPSPPRPLPSPVPTPTNAPTHALPPLSSAASVHTGKGSARPTVSWQDIVAQAHAASSAAVTAPTTIAEATLQVKRQELLAMLGGPLSQVAPQPSTSTSATGASTSWQTTPGPVHQTAHEAQAPQAAPRTQTTQTVPLKPIRNPAHPLQYTCKFPNCTGVLLDVESSCDAHVREHFPPPARGRAGGSNNGGFKRKDTVRCLWREGGEDCPSSSTVSDMGRHLMTHFSTVRWLCPVEGCDKFYEREDSTLRHMKDKH